MRSEEFYCFIKKMSKFVTLPCELYLEGIKITKKTVSKYYKRFMGEMILCELPQSVSPSMFKCQHYDFIEAKTLKTSYSAHKTISMNVIDSNSESSYLLRTKDNVIMYQSCD